MGNGMFEFLVGVYILMLVGLICTIWDIDYKGGNKDEREKRTT